MLGLCLKRYAYTEDGQAIRRNTRVDIPVEIGLPDFIQDNHMEGSGSLYGNFKLSLQSVVCHRGYAVDSGHYISLVRGLAIKSEDDGTPKRDPNQWMRFDDLASPRIKYVDIDKALKEEMPYLLFYQIMPVDGDPGHITDSEVAPSLATSERTNSAVGTPVGSSILTQSGTDVRLPPSRTSLDIPSSKDSRGRSSREERRSSTISFSEPDRVSARASVANGLTPKTPGQESPVRRTSASLSRSQSRTSEGGLVKTFSILTGRKSREVVPAEGTTEPQILTEEPIDVAVNTTVPVHDSGSRPVTPSTTLNKHKREKGKNRLALSLSKNKDDKEKQDRECAVM